MREYCCLCLVEELQRKGAVGRRRSSAERRREQRGFRNLLAGRAGVLGGPGVHVKAVGALGGAGHGQRDQLTILSGDLPIIAPDDGIQFEEALELNGGQLLVDAGASVVDSTLRTPHRV